jgi:hypothetical protein
MVVGVGQVRRLGVELIFVDKPQIDESFREQ